MVSAAGYAGYDGAAISSRPRGQNQIEPALEEMRTLMFGGKLTIAPHNSELLEELRHYHRDQDYRIVKQQDDLISALRYAIMMRRDGRGRSECEGVGYGRMAYSGQRSEQRAPTMASGLDFNLFATHGDY